MRASIGLCLWILAVIFPLAWLGSFSAAFRQAFDTVFSPQWMHIIMHTIQFAVLGILIILAWKPQLKARTVLALVLAFLGVGVLEEGFQMLTQGMEPWRTGALAAATFDLGVDLAGGLLGIGAWLLFKSIHREGWQNG